MQHVISLRTVLGLWAASFAVTFALQGAELVAKKNGVKVSDQPKKDAAIVLTLNQGDAVESIERQGMFWKVKTSAGKTGYVSFLEVNRKAGESSGSLSSAIREAARDSRDMDNVKGARSRTAVMGVRGLDESKETAFAGNVKPNLRMVYAMEDRLVSQSDVDKIGELVQREVAARLERETAP